MEDQLATINHPTEAERVFEDIWCPRDVCKDKGPPAVHGYAWYQWMGLSHP